MAQRPLQRTAYRSSRLAIKIIWLPGQQLEVLPILTYNDMVSALGYPAALLFIICQCKLNTQTRHTGIIQDGIHAAQPHELAGCLPPTPRLVPGNPK